MSKLSLNKNISQQLENMLITVYFSSFHSIVSCGIILWRQPPNALKIFRLQKTTIGIISGLTTQTIVKHLIHLL